MQSHQHLPQIIGVPALDETLATRSVGFWLCSMITCSGEMEDPADGLYFGPYGKLAGPDGTSQHLPFPRSSLRMHCQWIASTLQGLRAPGRAVSTTSSWNAVHPQYLAAGTPGKDGKAPAASQKNYRTSSWPPCDGA